MTSSMHRALRRSYEVRTAFAFIDEPGARARPRAAQTLRVEQPTPGMGSSLHGEPERRQTIIGA